MENTNDKLFTFYYEGKEYSIPAIKSIPSGAIRKTRHIEDEVDKSYSILEIVVGEDSEVLTVLDKMTISEFTEVISEWTQGASVGESSGSDS